MDIFIIHRLLICDYSNRRLSTLHLPMALLCLFNQLWRLYYQEAVINRSHLHILEVKR